MARRRAQVGRSVERSRTVPERPVAPAPSWPPWAVPVLLVAATVVAYLPVLRNGFVWDDDAYVTANTTLRSLDGLRRIWLEPGAVPQYYPLTFTSLWLDHQVWGLGAGGYHLVNVLLHALSAVLVWRLLVRLAVPGAALGAALFALHPVHVESVAWIAERKNVLSGVCYLGAALAYLRWALPVPGEAPAGRGVYALALGLFAAALLAKTVTCTLPVALGVVVWWKRGRLRTEDILPLVPFVVLGAVAGLVTVRMERTHVGARGAAWDLSLVQRVLVAGRALWFYLRSLALPVSLTFIYPRWAPDPTVWWQWLFPLAAAAALGGLVWARDRFGTGPIAAALFFGVTLAPALGFVDVYPMRYSFVADHFQYLASLGPLVLAGALAARWGRQGLGVALVALVVLGGLTWRQAHAYRDVETLWRDTLAKNQAATIAHLNLGTLLQEAGRLADAEASFRRVLALEPDAADARTNLANTLRSQGRLAEATALYREVAARTPYDPGAHMNLGNALAQGGALAEAMAQYEIALRLRPNHADTRANLATVLAMQGRTAEAIVQYRAALAVDPTFVDAHRNLARVLADSGQLDEAEQHLREILRLRPDDASVRADLAGLIAARTAP